MALVRVDQAGPMVAGIAAEQAGDLLLQAADAGIYQLRVEPAFAELDHQVHGDDAADDLAEFDQFALGHRGVDLEFEQGLEPVAGTTGQLVVLEEAVEILLFGDLHLLEQRLADLCAENIVGAL